MGYGRLSVCLKTSFRVFICLNGFGRLNKHNSSSHWFFYDKFFISLLLWLPEFSLTVKFYVFFFSLLKTALSSLLNTGHENSVLNMLVLLNIVSKPKFHGLFSTHYNYLHIFIILGFLPTEIFLTFTKYSYLLLKNWNLVIISIRDLLFDRWAIKKIIYKLASQ